MRLSTLFASALVLATLAHATTGHADAETGLPAQPAPTPAMHTGASLGFTLHRFQDDFALGGVVSSPSFLKSTMRLSLGGGVAWLPHVIGADGQEDWKTFYHGRLVVEVGPPLTEHMPIRPYGFGGVDLLVLPSGLSDQPVGLGGIGGFGVELPVRYPSHENAEPITFFVELGGVGNGKRADRLATSPLLANGFVATVGLRVYP